MLLYMKYSNPREELQHKKIPLLSDTAKLLYPEECTDLPLIQKEMDNETKG